MKVDMSPVAVRERLKTLEQLWVLSVKLMKAKKIASTSEKDKGMNRTRPEPERGKWLA
jgi:hypothetical protein